MGFLLGYGDRTRAAYLANLRDFHAWYARIGIGLLAAYRGHIEAYVRALEQAGRSRATVPGGWPPWPATATRFRRSRSPTTHIRRPLVTRDSQTLGLDREEAVRFPAAAEAASARDHTLACLLI